jgi:hypothetical protein
MAHNLAFGLILVGVVGICAFGVPVTNIDWCRPRIAMAMAMAKSMAPLKAKLLANYEVGAVDIDLPKLHHIGELVDGHLEVLCNADASVA